MVLLARGSVTVTAVNDGVPEKLYRAWSNNADGSGFSTTDSSRKYLGTYVGLSEPTLASQYKWTLIKGETGEPGQPGVSAYLHTAWANSANGQTGFSTSVSTDKLYIGTYSSSSPTPSQAYTSYKWVRVKGLDAKFYSVIVDKSFLNRNGLSSTATETIAINSYVHQGNSAGVAAPGFFIIKEQIKQTTAGVTTYVFQEKHRSTTAVSQLNYTVSANAVTVKIEFYLTNQFNNLFAVRDIGVLMDASTDIEARVPIAQLIENINNHPSTTRISGAKMHFTNDVTFDQSFHTKLFAETGFIENLSAYEFSADNIKTGTLSSVNGMSTMDLNTGAFSFAGGKLKYDGTTLSVVGSLTVASFAPALKTSFDGKLDTTKLAASGQVTIHGGNITAGTLSADKITTGTLDASQVTVTNLTADNITAGTLDVGKLTLENLSASDMKTGTLNASDVNIINLSASSIKTGTLDASSVNIDNLSANSIKGGRLDLSQGLTISDGVNDILSIGTDGKVALNASSIKIGPLDVATKKDVDEIALTPGPQGTSITSVTEWYLATSAATGVTTSTAGWDKTMRTMTTTNKYLWNYKVINYSEGLPQTTTPVIIGVYGTTGATGRSINSITKNYLATSESSGIVKTDSRFTKTIQSTSPTDKYLWTYETITWNVAPLTTYVEPFIIGTHGEKGEVGNTGVGIQSITEWYLATPLKEGVTRTTTGWKDSVQTLSSVNNYLWNYEQVNYDNGTKHYTDPTIIGTFGEQGISVKGVTEYYLASPLSEGISKDTPGWTTDIQPLTPENKYLWNKEIVHYSDDAAFLDKTEVLSGTEIFTDKADEESVVHVEVDGKSYQHAGNGKNLFGYRNIKNYPKHPNYPTEEQRHIELFLKPNTQYTLSSDIDYTGSIYFNGLSLTDSVKNESPQTRTTDSNGYIFILIFRDRNVVGAKLYDGSHYIQLEEGSIATEYEEYEPSVPSPDYPIEIHSLNNFNVVSSVGRENLALNSNKGWMSSVYKVMDGTLSEDWVVGETYTITIKGEVNAGNMFGVWRDTGGVRIPGSFVYNPETKTWSLTAVIPMPAINAKIHNVFSIYNVLSANATSANIEWVKIEKGSFSTPYSLAPKDIVENDNHPLIDKINLLLNEPLRSLGNIKDRLFRDNDGLWKVERKLALDNDLHNNPHWANISNYHTDNSSIFGINSAAYAQAKENGVMISSHFITDRGLNGVVDGQGIFLATNPRLRLRVWNTLVGIEIDDSVSVKLTKFKNWLTDNPISIQYELASPTTEILSQTLQEKLNNIQSYKDSNYIYTVLPDKSNILSENLKSTLHATFKSKAWAGNFAGYPSIIGVYGDSAKLLYLSTSADSMTFNSDGSANPASQTITFTGNLQNVLGNVIFTAIAYNGTTVVSTISLSGVGNTRTLTQAQFPASADRIQVKATLGNLEDTVTIVKLKNGADAIVGYLTNESITLAANNAGTVASFTNATGTFKVFEGLIDRTSPATFRVKSQSGATAAINNSSGVYTISAMSADMATVVFEATYNGVKIDQTLSLAKSREGAKGDIGVSITKVDVEYYLHTSATVAPPTTGWNTTAPAWVDGRYMWSRTVTTYSSGDPTISTPVCITGAKGSTGGTGSTGATGRGVSSIVEQFYLSNSKDTQTSGVWSTTMPTWSVGKYVWTRSLITYTTGTPATSTTEPLVSSEWEAINELEVGGRNLLIGSNNLINRGSISGFTRTVTANGELMTTNTAMSGYFHDNGILEMASNLDNMLEEGQTYTFSVQVKSPNSSGTMSVYANTRNYLKMTGTVGPAYSTMYITLNWIKGNGFGIHFNYQAPSGSILYLKNPKLEKGNKATDWSPAPEDITASIKAAQDKANAASQEAIAAQADATVGKNMADNLSNDSIITQVEKLELKREWDAIVKEKPSITIQATDYSLQGSAEATAYNTAYTALNNSIPSLLANMNVTSGVARSTFNTNFANYYDKRQLLLNRIAKKAKELADIAQSSVDRIGLGGRNLIIDKDITVGMYVQEANGIPASAATHAMTDFIPVVPNSDYILSAMKGLVQIRIVYYTSAKVFISGVLYSGNQGSEKRIKTPANAAFVRWSGDNISLSKLTEWMFERDIQAGVDKAQADANSASNSASTANSLLTDIASDSVLTPGEKKSTKKEWDIIVGEKPKIDASADTYSITTQKTAYTNAYNALNTYLTGSSGLLVNLNIKSAIVGTTFRTNFKNYYNARQDLLNAIADGAKSLVDGIEIGGVNLLKNSNFKNALVDWSINGTVAALTVDGRSVARITNATSAGFYAYPTKLVSGSIYTISFDAKSVSGTSVMKIGFLNEPDNRHQNFNFNTTWKRYSYTITAPIVNEGQYFHFYSSGSGIGTGAYVTNIQLEKGNKATDWTPAPEDVQSQINKSVKSTDVEYYLSTSNTGLAGGSWLTTAPPWDNGKYMWSRTKVVLNDGTTTYKPSSSGTNITGAKGATGGTGATGRGVSSIVEQYYLSTSKTTQTGGSWVSTPPPWAPGKYIWTRSFITYTTGTPATDTTKPLVSSEWEAVNELEIGGRNLVLNSAVLETSGLGSTSGSSAEYQTINTGQSYMDLKNGEIITISFDIEMKIATANPTLQVYNSNLPGPVGIPTVAVGNQLQGTVGQTINKRISFTTQAATRGSSSYSYNTLEFYSVYGSSNFFKISKLKVERGNKATDWSPAPEDLYQYVDEVEIGGENLFAITDTVAGYTTNGNITSSTEVHRSMNSLIDVGDAKSLVYQIWNPNKTINSANSNRVAFFTEANVFISAVNIPYINGSTYQMLKFEVPTNARKARLAAIMGIGTIDPLIKIKFEKGNKPTDWSPSQEDVAVDVNKKTYNPVRYIRDWSNGSTANGGNHWYELMAIDEYGNNRALNRPVTSNATGTNLNQVTNGAVPGTTYASISNNGDSVYVRVDLGKVYYDITEIKVWKYYNDGRTYYENKTEVSSDGTTWYPIYDYTVEGNYAATEQGKSIPNTIAKTHSILTGEGTKNIIDGKADQSATSDILKSMRDAIDIALQEKTAAGLQNELSAFIKAYNAKQEAEAKEKVASENRIKSLEGREVLTDTYYGSMSAVKTFIDRTFYEGEEGLMIKNGKEGTHILINDEEISFFSDGTKTAYISQNKLSISDGTFIENLQIGNISASNETSKNHLTFRYTPPS